MATESQLNSTRNRALASLTIVKPNLCRQTTVRESKGTALKTAIGTENLAALRRAVAMLCLLWFSLNAIATAAPVYLEPHAWLNLIVAMVLAYCSAVDSGASSERTDRAEPTSNSAPKAGAFGVRKSLARRSG